MFRPTLIMLAAGALLLAASPTAMAAAVEHTDQGTFIASSGATLFVDYPATAGSALSYTENGVTLSNTNGFNTFVDEWTANHAGNEFAVSGPENYDMDLGGEFFAAGFWLEDGNEAPGPCGFMDSYFDITYLKGATVVYATGHDFIYGDMMFFGVISDTAFDTIQIRERGSSTTGEEFAFCENDPLGDIYLAATPVEPIPELPTSMLALVGLGVLGVVAAVVRRRA